MSRLIIVDQSLKGLGGHHFDYTLQVAKAAAERQCEVIVATNRKFRSCSRLDLFARIHPVFRNTSYSRFSLLAGLRAMFGQAPLQLGIGKRSCPLRIAHENPASTAERIHGLVQSQLTRIKSVRKRVNSQWKYIRESTGRNRVVKSFAKDCQSLFRSIGLQCSDHVFFPTISDLDLAGLLTYWMSNPESHLPTWHMQFHFDAFVGRSPDYRRQLVNLGPLQDLFNDVERAVPSYQLNYYATTAAIADQYQRLSSRQVSELTYPISEGFFNPEAMDRDNVISVESVISQRNQANRPAFEDLSSNHGYWDAGQSRREIPNATGQDNVTGQDLDNHILSLNSLPETNESENRSKNFDDTIEETAELFPGHHHGIPIVVAGGVRDEKGQATLKDLLPNLAEQVFDEKLGFLVCQRKEQKKWWKKPAFCLAKGGRSQAERASVDDTYQRFNEHICYLPHPLELNRYQQLIRRAGIGLLAYDRESYANRRAGIFGEYLAAGVPVLVPAGTWMADQLNEPNLRYLQKLETKLDHVQRISFDQLDWADWNVPTAGRTISFDGSEVPAYAWSPKLKNCPVNSADHESEDRTSNSSERLVRVGFQWLWPKEAGTYCKVQLLFHSEDNQVLGSASRVVGGSGDSLDCQSWFRIPASTASIRFGFSNAYHERNCSIAGLKIDTFRSANAVPLGAVGLTYDHVEQIPELLAEMCRYYPHYRNNAIGFARDWHDLHDPLQTVTQLMSTSQSAASWAA